MSTPTPPVPQWAVDAAKAVMLADREAADWGHLQTEKEVADIIAAHAPRSHEEIAGRDVLALCRELRAACNNMTPADREKYHDIGMRIIYGDATAIDAAMKKDL